MSDPTPAERSQLFVDHRRGNGCPNHLLRHWCTQCRDGDFTHDDPHICAYVARSDRSATVNPPTTGEDPTS